MELQGTLLRFDWRRQHVHRDHRAGAKSHDAGYFRECELVRRRSSGSALGRRRRKCLRRARGREVGCGRRQGTQRTVDKLDGLFNAWTSLRVKLLARWL